MPDPEVVSKIAKKHGVSEKSAAHTLQVLKGLGFPMPEGYAERPLPRLRACRKDPVRGSKSDEDQFFLGP